MSNLMSVLPISSGESPSLPPLKERNTLLGDERPFARWLEESCRDSSRQSPRENGKAKSNPQDKSSDSPSPAISADAETAGAVETLEEMIPIETASVTPLLMILGQEEEPVPESTNAELSEESLLGTEEPVTRISTPLLNLGSQQAEQPSSAPIQKPAEAASSEPAPTVKSPVEALPPLPAPTPAPQVAQAPAEDTVQTPDSVSAIPLPASPLPAQATSTPPETTASTPQPDVDMATLSEPVPPPPETSDRMPPPDWTAKTVEDWTAEAVEETMESPPQSMSPPPSTPSAPAAPASEASTAVPETVDLSVTQVPGADSAEGFGEKNGSRSFQSHEESMAHRAIQSQPVGAASETLSTEAPAPLPPPSSTAAPLPTFMQPAVLAQNLDRLVLHSVRSDSHSIRVELEPVSLGRVTLQCRETSEGLNVEIQVQNNQIRSLLSAQEQELRTSLESQGMQMGKFSVTCRDGEGRSDGDRPGQRRDPDSPDGEGRRVEAKTATGTTGTERGTRMGTRNRWVA